MHLLLILSCLASCIPPGASGRAGDPAAVAHSADVYVVRKPVVHSGETTQAAFAAISCKEKRQRTEDGGPVRPTL